jgi:hypothetical protein
MEQVYFEGKVFNVVSESKNHLVIDYLKPQQVGYTKLTVKKSTVARYESLDVNSPEMLIFKSKLPEITNRINQNIKNLIRTEKYKDYLTAVYKDYAIYCCANQVCLRSSIYLSRRIGVIKEVASFSLEKANSSYDHSTGQEDVDVEILDNLVNETKAIEKFIKVVFEIILNEYFQNEQQI